jgi:hypothetical protein
MVMQFVGPIDIGAMREPNRYTLIPTERRVSNIGRTLSTLSLASATVVTIAPSAQVGTGTVWSQAAMGNRQDLGIQNTSLLRSWGYGNYGALGQGDVVNRSSPCRVGALTT